MKLVTHTHVFLYNILVCWFFFTTFSIFLRFFSKFFLNFFWFFYIFFIHKKCDWLCEPRYIMHNLTLAMTLLVCRCGAKEMKMTKYGQLCCSFRNFFDGIVTVTKYFIYYTPIHIYKIKQFIGGQRMRELIHLENKKMNFYMSN